MLDQAESHSRDSTTAKPSNKIIVIALSLSTKILYAEISVRLALLHQLCKTQIGRGRDYSKTPQIGKILSIK